MRKFFFIIIVALFHTSGALSLVSEEYLLSIGQAFWGNVPSLYAEPNLAPIDTTGATIHGFRIINTYPHDPEAFTQGLVFHKGYLYEGTGLHGHSTLRKVELRTGRLLKSHRLPIEFFGEGITIWQNKLIQLTWQSHTGFIYDHQSFRLMGTFSYPTEGWGITCDGNNLIMSNGTAILRFIDPRKFTVVKQIEVKDRGRPVPYLNELEYIKGEIFANVWDTGYIARISPQTGRVLGWIDLRGLYRLVDDGKRADVLNGIAYDTKNNRLFVTGKFWPKLFEIRLEAQK